MRRCSVGQCQNPATDDSNMCVFHTFYWGKLNFGRPRPTPVIKATVREVPPTVIALGPGGGEGEGG